MRKLQVYQYFMNRFSLRRRGLGGQGVTRLMTGIYRKKKTTTAVIHKNIFPDCSLVKKKRIKMISLKEFNNIFFLNCAMVST